MSVGLIDFRQGKAQYRQSYHLFDILSQTGWRPYNEPKPFVIRP